MNSVFCFVLYFNFLFTEWYSCSYLTFFFFKIYSIYPICVCVCMCVCPCLCTYMYGVAVTWVPVPVECRSPYWVYLLITLYLHLIVWKNLLQNPSLPIWLCWLAGKLLDSSYLYLLGTGVISECHCTCPQSQLSQEVCRRRMLFRFPATQTQKIRQKLY